MAFVLRPEKRRRALDLLRHSHVSRLSPEAQLAYAVGLIICDEDGTIDRRRLDAALADSVTCSAARELLRRAS